MIQLITVYIDKIPKFRIEVDASITLKKLLETSNIFIVKNIENINFEEYEKTLQLSENDYLDDNILNDEEHENYLFFKRLKNGKLFYKSCTCTIECVKASELKKNGYKDIDDWETDKNNIYIGPRRKIYEIIDGYKICVGIKESKWKDPYTKIVNKQEAKRLYELYLVENDLLQFLPELKGKTLGCLCNKDSDNCHALILQRLVNSLHSVK